MFNVRDQVIVKEATRRSGPVTREIKVGTIMAIGENEMTVSFPLPGGRFTKKVVSTIDCQEVTEVFKRNSVQINPIFRQIYKGAV